MEQAEIRRLAGGVEPIVKEAGTLLLKIFGGKIKETLKQDNSTVTQADVRSEDFLKEELAALLPQAGIIAEESQYASQKEYAWVIDPLDGTTNFARGIPYFSISVALTRQSKPILAVVYDPLHDDYFLAIRGEGARCNGLRVRVSAMNMPIHSLILVSLPYRKTELLVELMALTTKLSSHVHGIRSLGSVALDLASVAAGKAEAAVLSDLGWWDVAAGMLLVTEAGGTVSTFTQLPVTPSYTTCVAGNPALYDFIIGVLKAQ